MTKFIRAHTLWLFAIWAILFWFFYSLNAGITCTNDGSHFALIKSLYERSSAELGENIGFARHDSAYFKGKMFSDRNPGTALICWGLLKVFSPILPFLSELQLDPAMPNQTAESNRLTAFCMLIPALCGALLFLTMSQVFFRLELSKSAAILFALVLVLTTLVLRYSTVLYSHILATLLTANVLLCSLSAFRPPYSFRAFVGAVFLLSLAVLVEHPTAVVFVPLGACGLWCFRSQLLYLKRLVVVTIAGLLPLIPLFIYNYLNFNHPFSIAHFHHSANPALHQALTIIEFNAFSTKLWQLLFEKEPWVSLFGSSEYFYLLLLLIPIFWRRTKWGIEHFFVLVAFIFSILPAALTAVTAGYDLDYRQILFGLPFLAVFLALGLKYLLELLKKQRILVQCLGAIMCLPMLYRAFNIHFAHIRHQYQPEFECFLINFDAALSNTLLVIIGGALFPRAYRWFIYRSSLKGWKLRWNKHIK